MWENEQQLSGALKSEVDGPAPAVRTDLTDVLRRGRRRLLVRRAGTTAGLLAVVGVVGFGSVALRGLAGSDDSPPAVGTTDAPVLTTAPATVGPEWAMVDRPARTPYGTFTPAWTAPPPAGREILAVPLCDLSTIGEHTTWLRPRPPAHVLNAWVLAVGQAAAPATVSEPHVHMFPANKEKHADSVDAYTHWIDVTDEHGTGSVDLGVGRTTLAPLAAADEELFAQGNCAPPRRVVQPDGTVLQYYPVYASEPFQSLNQVLRIYTPTGDLYEISVRNFGSPDFSPQEDQRAFNRTGAGRETLPLTEEQLTRIGLAVADAG